MADDEELEYTLLTKKEVLVYQIPPASSASGHKADDWKKCIWRGKCRVAGKGIDLSIKMLDASSGALFAQCAIPGGDYDKYVERVIDSSRYFVLKITNGDRHAFIGLGFEDRNDAFDFNCTLADFKSTWVDRDKQVEELAGPQGPAKDLSLKDGQKIKINLDWQNQGGEQPRRRREQKDTGTGGGGFGILAPPPSGGQSRRQPAAQQAVSPLAAPPAAASGYGGGALAAPPAAASGYGAGAAFPAPAPAPADDFFGDFDDFQSAGATAAPAPAATQALPMAMPAPAQASPAPAGTGLANQMDMLSLGGFGGPSSPSPAPSPMPMQQAFSPQPAAQPMMQASPAPAKPSDPFSGFAGLDMLGGSSPQPQAPAFTSPPAPTQQRPKAGGSDPFDEFDIFK